MTVKLDHSYFKQAASWADDNYGLLKASRARYQTAFYLSLGSSLAMALAITLMMPLKTIQTVAVHHYDNGITTVEAESKKTSPINRAQIESDLVRYINNRESYDVSSYRSQYKLIQLLSDTSVAREYESQQSSRNPEAPINHLGTKFTRNVHIYSINFIDDENLNAKERKVKQTHHNLAEVVFAIQDHDKAANRDSEQQFTALISWHYISPSNSIEERWQNFDGFEVTRYTKAQRNI